MTASAAMLLPLPDSPTMPRVSRHAGKAEPIHGHGGLAADVEADLRPLTSRMVPVIASSAWG
ncbi:MAG: hypothetical protein ACLR0N_10710 [Bilophila wadsworthia]